MERVLRRFALVCIVVSVAFLGHISYRIAVYNPYPAQRMLRELNSIQADLEKMSVELGRMARD